MLSEVETGQNDRPTIPVIHSATVVSYPGFDTDGDGVIDTEDDFPDNPDETTDSDGDGVGDNSMSSRLMLTKLMMMMVMGWATIQMHSRKTPTRLMMMMAMVWQ